MKKIKSLYCYIEGRVIWFVLGLFILVGLSFLLPHNIRLAAFKFTNPKPITQSKTVLPQAIQQAIETLAKQDLKNEQAVANLAIQSLSSTGEPGLLTNTVLSLQEVVTPNPSEKAKIKIKKIDNLIASLQKQTPTQIVETIKEIGKETDQVVKDPNVQSDRSVLQLLIEQYNRLQLILQQMEDKLPVADYLKIEDARQKYLVVTATASINNAPNLDVVHNIALKEVEKVVGADFAELKAIEVISDFEAGIKPEAKAKLLGLERQIALDFEKRMLKLPRNVREKKLQDFIKYSFGNPLKQIQAFDRMKDFLSNKQIISGVDYLKELTIKKLDNRISELNIDAQKNHQLIQYFNQVKSNEASKGAYLFDVSSRTKAQAFANHLLQQVNDPQIFDKYQEFIAQNPKVKTTLQSYLGSAFFNKLANKKQIIDKLSKQEQQKLYEKIQQIEQTIFITANGQKSDIEKQLPSDIQKQIEDLKAKLAEKQIPKLDTPEGVSLPEVARLPDEVSQAIVQIAKDKIAQANLSKEAKLDLEVQAKDLGVAEPVILPGNPLYLVKELIRNVDLLITFDPIQKAEELIKQDNEKTLEAAKLVEESSSQTVIATALKTLSSVQEDFDKLKAHAGDLHKLEQTQPQQVDKLVNQIIENGLARQTVFSAIEEKVHGDEYVEVEKIRTDVLKDGVDALLQLTNNNVQELAGKLEAAVEQSAGSQLKEIKAVELLTEIARTQPETTLPILEQSEANLAQALETKLLEMPKEQRVEEVLNYAESESGNPVRQFEAAEVLKDDFKNPETILLTESIKDKAVENLEERVSEITDASSRQEFVDEVVGNKPEDLKIAVEIETRVESPAISVQPTPIVEKIEEIKAEVEQNIIEEFKDKPQQLAQTELLTNTSPDVGDIKTVTELVEALERSPEVAPTVVAAVQKAEQTILNEFVQEISSPNLTTVLSPVPETITELVELKNQTSPEVDVKIDVAIQAEVKLIEEHISTQVNDQLTLQTYEAQVQQDPVVAQIVAQVGGSQFTQVVDQKAEDVAQEASKEQTQLQNTVEQVTQEVFSQSNSAAEQSLPQTIQQQVEEIKQQVPVEQVQVTVQAQVTTPEPAASTAPAPTSAPAPETPQAPPASTAPAPAAPEPAPAVSEPAPAAPAPAPVEAPAAPAAPSI